jgi:hypothetical protein
MIRLKEEISATLNYTEECTLVCSLILVNMMEKKKEKVTVAIITTKTENKDEA